MPGIQSESASLDEAGVFVQRVREYLQRGEEDALVQFLRRDWPQPALLEMLQSDNPSAASAAAICLGLVGDDQACGQLSAALHHDDYEVVEMAEKALWSIWFRGSNRRSRTMLRRAAAAIQDGHYDRAHTIIARILDDNPDFAEAHNRRAVLYYLTGRFERSLMDCFKTLSLNPHHFGAAAGIGHNFMQLGRYTEAADAYRQTLNLHPRMAGVRQALRQAREMASPSPAL